MAWWVALVVAALMGLLATLLDSAARLSIPGSVPHVAGIVYFALLVGAPLLLYPVAWLTGKPLRARVAISLLPFGLWWLSEVWMRIDVFGHSLPEALLLSASFFNVAHLQLLILAMTLAEVGCRVAARLRRRPAPRLGWRGGVGVAVCLLVLGNPMVAVPWFPAHSTLYETLFQDALPLPRSLPGPVADLPRPAAAGELPNIVVILSDDHRYDAAGYAGHPFVETPGLDRLAAEGMRFERAFVTSSLCSPSRASYLTGVYPQRHGVFNNFTPWSDGNRTFFEYLKPRGYRTAFIGKWHMPGALPELRGVDEFVTFTILGGQGRYLDCPLVVNGSPEASRKPYIAEELTDRVIEFIRAAADEPFLVYLSHKSVHSSFAPDELEAGRYADAAVQLPPGSQPWSHFGAAQYTHFTPWSLENSLRRYGEAVTSMDRQIERLLDVLDELDLAENTLVIYTSDNGYLWGEHGLTDKRWAYEESIRVPMLLRLPGRAAPGSASSELVLNVDLAPTLLALAGVEVPGSMQGASLLPLLDDRTTGWRDDFYYSYWFEPPYPAPTVHALRTREYKYLEEPGRGAALYDLEADPRETRSLPIEGRVAESLAERLHSLRARVEGG